MLSLFLSGLLLLFLCGVSGTAISKIAKLDAILTERLLLGLAATNTITTILSLFIPVNGYVTIALLVASVLLCLFIWDELKSLTALVKKNRLILLFAVPFIAYAFIISLNAPFKYDSGLYHIQAIKWIEQYRVVPGLANLQGRFGFNPNIFTAFALSSLTGLFGQEIFSVNFAVFAVLAVYFVNRLWLIYKNDGISNQLVFFIIIFLSIILLYDNFSSPTPDFLSVALPLFILARTVELSEKNTLGIKSFVPVIVLGVYILTTKLAALPLMLLAVIIAFKYRREFGKIAWLLAASAVIVLPWLIRNVVLSGWLIYPFPSLNLFSFDWQVPLSKVIIEKDTVTGWARISGGEYAAAAKMAICQWFPIWWRILTLQGKLYVIGALFCPPIVFLWQVITKKYIGFYKNAVIATAFAGFVFWFLVAPDFRFGQAFIVVAAMSPLLVINFRWQFLKNGYAGFAALLLMLFIFQGITGRVYLMNAIAQIKQLTIRPQLIPQLPNMDYNSYKLNGVTVYTPKIGDRCFCHDLPCTPHKDTTITMRDTTVAGGFKPLTQPGK